MSSPALEAALSTPTPITFLFSPGLGKSQSSQLLVRPDGTWEVKRHQTRLVQNVMVQSRILKVNAEKKTNKKQHAELRIKSQQLQFVFLERCNNNKITLIASHHLTASRKSASSCAVETFLPKIE